MDGRMATESFNQRNLMHTEARLNFSIVPEKELEPIFLEFFLEFFLEDTFHSQSEAEM